MLVFCDVDETILSWSPVFQKWIEAKGYKTNGNLIDRYSVEGWVDGLSMADMHQLMYEFGQTDIMINQPADPSALEIIPRMAKEGCEFIAITACGNDEWFAKQRRKTLEDTFGIPWQEVHTLPLGGSKYEILKNYEPSIWVEDNHAHAVHGWELGYKTFLIDQAYNRIEHNGIIRVKDWYQIYDKLKEDKNAR